MQPRLLLSMLAALACAAWTVAWFTTQLFKGPDDPSPAMPEQPAVTQKPPSPLVGIPEQPAATQKPPLPRVVMPEQRAAQQPPSLSGRLPTVDRHSREPATAVAMRGPSGHFVFEVEVNGVPVPMIFDTGASHVVLRGEDAARLGIDTAALRYSISIGTVNGAAEAAPAVIAEMKVGGIIRTNVAAVVTRPGRLPVNLLGQTFLATMAGFTTEGNRVVLRGN